MTLPFKEEVVNDGDYSEENFIHPNFIGYLNKYGDVLDYSSPLGIGGHDNNPLTAYFENYFRMPTYDSWKQFDEGVNVIDIELEKWLSQEWRNFFEKEIKRLVKYPSDKNDVYSVFEADLNKFFYNCYQADTFMDGFGQNCMSLNESEFCQKFCNGTNRFSKFPKYYYHWYKKRLMLDWYKTVIVQYMHYHLVERCNKGITTCSLKPYETFYNYLLNDFTIHQIPRMVYDFINKRYIPYEQNKILIPDSELRLKEEIQAIKKLVPLNQRSRYYR